MKQATIVEVRDVPASNDNVHLGNRKLRQEVEELLRRYPSISEGETAKVRNFLATGSHMDIGLVAGSDELKEKVIAFRKQHRRQLGLKLHEVVIFLVIAGGPVGALLWRYLA
jgi:hypothetical protein